MRPRLAALAFAALLAALAACSGGAAPPEASPPIEATSTPAPTTSPAPEAASTPAPAAAATPEATSTPAPTATATREAASTPAPPATATPTPRSGLELIEPAPGAFVHRTFEDGEAIDWAHGVYVFDVETGLTEGYARAGVENYAGFPDIYGARGYSAHRGGWITSSDEDDEDREWRLLLDRETGRSWRWPSQSSLVLEATSEEHLLFGDGTGSTGRFILADRLMKEVARFSVGHDGWPRAMFSPDGRAIALAAADKVYLVSVTTGRPAILFDPPSRHPEHGTPLLGAGFSPRREPPYESWLRWDGGRGIVATASYENEEVPRDKTDNSVKERRYFSWDGEELPAPACPGTLSPDGRYAVVSLGIPYYAQPDHLRLAEPWPSVVVTDAVTCAPILRVRSAYTYETFWFARWLATSDGIVVGVRDGYSIVRVRPAPGLVSLPVEWPGPEPATTGGGRYFGYGSQVYDAAGDRWHGPPYGGGPFWWGDSHRERWSHFLVYWGQGRISWLLLPPKIEYPPFDDEIAFRVARTGSCLRLREDPGEESRVLGCLPDGERLLLADRGESGPVPKPDAAPYASLFSIQTGNAPRYPDPGPDADPYDSWLLHPSIALLGPSQWVRVRTADGAEGWVSHDYLDHD